AAGRAIAPAALLPARGPARRRRRHGGRGGGWVGVMRRLIVNGDDFGASLGINRGIVEAHERGVLTSASLMVDRPAAADAVTRARANPVLSLGLHLELDSSEPRRAAAQCDRQLARVLALT